MHPRQSVLDCQGCEDVNARLGGLEIHTGEIQNTLHAHMHDSAQWHQQQQQQMAHMNVMLKQQHDTQAAY